MAMVRQQVNHQVEKWSDVNHAKKSLGTVALSQMQYRAFRIDEILRDLTHLPTASNIA